MRRFRCEELTAEAARLARYLTVGERRGAHFALAEPNPGVRRGLGLDCLHRTAIFTFRPAAAVTAWTRMG